ncbi:copper chaperone [Candidatus Bathyarchaeota archaeon]|nr:copper chaperone [Candidatus Bathyarchaeota archaeon]
MEEKVASGTIRFGNGNQIRESFRRMEEAREAIGKLDGVLRVKTNHVTHMFYVEYDSEKVSFERIRKEVKSFAK